MVWGKDEDDIASFETCLFETESQPLYPDKGLGRREVRLWILGIVPQGFLLWCLVLGEEVGQDIARGQVQVGKRRLVDHDGLWSGRSKKALHKILEMQGYRKCLTDCHVEEAVAVKEVANEEM